jgi:hypothetical protein
MYQNWRYYMRKRQARELFDYFNVHGATRCMVLFQNCGFTAENTGLADLQYDWFSGE